MSVANTTLSVLIKYTSWFGRYEDKKPRIDYYMRAESKRDLRNCAIKKLKCVINKKHYRQCINTQNINKNNDSRIDVVAKYEFIRCLHSVKIGIDHTMGRLNSIRIQLASVRVLVMHSA